MRYLGDDHFAPCSTLKIGTGTGTAHPHAKYKTLYVHKHTAYVTVVAYITYKSDTEDTTDLQYREQLSPCREREKERRDSEI